MNAQKRVTHLKYIFVLVALVIGIWAIRQITKVDIWTAVEGEDLDAIQRYADSGGDLDTGSLLYGKTPLFHALRLHKKTSYRKLLKVGASPNTLCRGGNVVIHFAASQKDCYWLRLALEHGADPNLWEERRGSMPLAFAMFEGRLENVKLLCAHGADINAPDRYGRTPLTLASDAAEFEIVYYLLEKGANYTDASHPGFTFLDSFRKKTPNFYARFPGDTADWCTAVRSWLKKHGADPDKAEWNGEKWVFGDNDIDQAEVDD